MAKTFPGHFQIKQTYITCNFLPHILENASRYSIPRKVFHATNYLVSSTIDNRKEDSEELVGQGKSLYFSLSDLLYSQLAPCLGWCNSKQERWNAAATSIHYKWFSFEHVKLVFCYNEDQRPFSLPLHTEYFRFSFLNNSSRINSQQSCISHRSLSSHVAFGWLFIASLVVFWQETFP